MGINIDDLGGGTTISDWGLPYLIDTNVYQDRIELVYKQDSMITFTGYPSSSPDPQIYKIIYSCKKGKWHESEKIYGAYISAKIESYLFND